MKFLLSIFCLWSVQGQAEMVRFLHFSPEPKCSEAVDGKSALCHLRTVLKGLSYLEHFVEVVPEEYDNIFETSYSKNYGGNFPWPDSVADHDKWVLDFFLAGKEVSLEFLEGVLRKEKIEAFRAFLAQGEYPLFTFSDDKVKFNYSVSFVDGMYILTGIPIQWSGPPWREGSSRISTTSLKTWAALKKRREKFSGLGVDMGSGTGVLAIGLLKKSKEIQKIYGLEIDDHAMAVSKINAELNGVGDRFEVLNNWDANSDKSKLTEALAGAKLDFAVSNPPFNIVPEKYSEAFTDFGFGGADGLFVTSGIFMEQLKTHLKENGLFVFYSELGHQKDQQRFQLMDRIERDHGGEFSGTLNICEEGLNSSALALSIKVIADEGQHDLVPLVEDSNKECSLVGLNWYPIYDHKDDDIICQVKADIEESGIFGTKVVVGELFLNSGNVVSKESQDCYASIGWTIRRRADHFSFPGQKSGVRLQHQRIEPSPFRGLRLNEEVMRGIRETALMYPKIGPDDLLEMINRLVAEGYRLENPDFYTELKSRIETIEQSGQ